MNELQQKLNHLKWLKAAGIEYYSSEQKDSKNSLLEEIVKSSEGMPKIKATPAPVKKQKLDMPKKAKTPTTTESDSRKLAGNASTISELKEALENFEGCDLKNFAQNTVFAEGSEDSKIMIIGEAPGAKEDEAGVPFCGESGILLDKMLESIGLSREKNVYITNTIFWRPPANRKPTAGEIDICKPFVEKHIALIKPKMIILVGATATASLLGKKEKISDIRQNNYSYTNQYLSEPIHTTAIFHPAYLLRQATQKKTTWYDLLKIKDWLSKNGIIT